MRKAIETLNDGTRVVNYDALQDIRDDFDTDVLDHVLGAVRGKRVRVVFDDGHKAVEDTLNFMTFTTIWLGEAAWSEAADGNWYGWSYRLRNVSMIILLDDEEEKSEGPCDLHRVQDCASCTTRAGECDWGTCTQPETVTFLNRRLDGSIFEHRPACLRHFADMVRLDDRAGVADRDIIRTQMRKAGVLCGTCGTSTRPAWCWECGQNHGARVEVVGDEPRRSER